MIFEATNDRRVGRVISYVDYMKNLADERMRKLMRGVTEVYLTDLPDHPNVGDSAIVLGEYAFLSTASIEVKRSFAVGTLPKRLFDTGTPVVIQGGGNIGGLYPYQEQHRRQLALRLPASTLLIQAPQSINFLNEAERRGFLVTVGSRSKFRIAVRDDNSAQALSSIAGEVILAPDAFHCFGAVTGIAPVKRVVVLARRDDESVSDDYPASAVDWLDDYRPLRQTTRIRKHSWRVPFLNEVVNPTATGWHALARRRFDRGIAQIEPGETIVTDRLHAMLIGLQMGRNVIAVDNNNQKLTRYANSWFGPTQPNLLFAKDFEDAARIAK